MPSPMLFTSLTDYRRSWVAPDLIVHAAFGSSKRAAVAAYGSGAP